MRIAFPLAALAASGHQLPLLPYYEYGPLKGDAPGYLLTARRLNHAWTELGAAAAAAAALALGVLVAGVFAWRRWPRRRVWVLAGTVLGLALAFTPAILELPRVPSGAVGWPLLWSVPVAAAEALGMPAQWDDDWGFAVGLVLSLAASAVTTVAVAYAGAFATGRRSVGVLAATLYALWPVLAGFAGGHTAARNDQWEAEVGLQLTTEPIAAALVTTGLALVLRPRARPLDFAIAGVVLGYSILVRPPNAVVATLALALVLSRSRAGALAFAAGGAALLPVFVAFLPKKTGYDLSRSDESGALWALDYAASSWLDSSLWHPRTLLVVGVPALIGVFAVRRPAAVLLGGSILATAALYSTFRATAEHPRYLYVVLPSALVLAAAGLHRIARAVRSS